MKCKTKGRFKLHCKKHYIDVIDDNKTHERNYVKEAIEIVCKKVLEEKLQSQIITENDVTDLQNTLVILNYHEKELFYSKYYSQIVHKIKPYLKDLKENINNYFNKISTLITGSLKILKTLMEFIQKI